MIKVKISPKNIRISGHALHDEYGKDIVCSSVSSIVTTSVNAIIMFNEKSIKYIVKEGLVNIDIKKNVETTKKLLDNMVNLLEELAQDYPKNIKVERE